MVLGRKKDQSQLVVTTFSKVPSSNAAVAQSGVTKKAVVRRNVRVSSTSSRSSVAEKPEDAHTNDIIKDENSTPTKDAAVKKSNNTKDHTDKPPGPFSFKRVASNPLRWRTANTFERSSTSPLAAQATTTTTSALNKYARNPFRKSRSIVEKLLLPNTTDSNSKPLVPDSISLERIDEQQQSQNHDQSSESEQLMATAGAATEHHFHHSSNKRAVKFTEEAIATDLLNKQRKEERLRNDPVLILHRMLCTGLLCSSLPSWSSIYGALTTTKTTVTTIPAAKTSTALKTSTSTTTALKRSASITTAIKRSTSTATATKTRQKQSKTEKSSTSSF